MDLHIFCVCVSTWMHVCLCVSTWMYVYRLSAEGVDIVLDCLCGEDTNRGISILKPMGKYLLYGKPNSDNKNHIKLENRRFFSPYISYIPNATLTAKSFMQVKAN